MMRKRLTRALSSTSAALALLTATLATPVASLAATPNWSGTLTALPPAVSLDAAAGYRAEVTNNGPSNVSQLYVSVTFSQPYAGGAPHAGSPAPVYVRLLNDGVEVTGTCGSDPLGGPLDCAVGGLRAGASASLTVAYATSGASPAGVSVMWTTVGLGSGSGDSSHGDVLTQIMDDDPQTPAPSPTRIVSDVTNFDGGFATDEAGTTFATSQSLGAGNLFGTSFSTPAQFIPVAIEDDADRPGCGSAAAGCYGIGASNAVVLSINEGIPFGTLQPVVTTVYKDAVPKGANVKQVTVVHYFDAPKPGPDGTQLLYEEIANSCPKTGTPSTTCRSVTWDGKTGIWTITIWLGENGYVKYH